MKSILLAVPHEHSLDALYPPVGLLYLAAATRTHGHEVKVMVGQVVGDEAILKEFEKKYYDYFGTTILTPLREASYDLIRNIKRMRPECTIIVGGPHVSILPEQTLRHVPEIDIAVIGEGEETLAEILSGKSLENIAGILYRKGTNLYRTKQRASLHPNCIPMPAWDLIDLTPYRSYEKIVIDGKELGPMLTVYSSRGCTGSCSFCSTWWVWKRWRQISAVQFAEEIEYLYQRGINHFFIADDSMINTEDFVDVFLEEIQQRKLKIHFKIACRADKITPHIAHALKQAGCYEVHVGFESGSQRILDAMGKKITVEQNIQAAEALRKAGIRVYALMVIGHIDETLESINETIDFLERIKPDVVASMAGLMLLPGTRDYQRAKREGFISDDFWLGKEPFLYYTKNFSREELLLIREAITRRRKIRSRNSLKFQIIWQKVKGFKNIMNPKFIWWKIRQSFVTLTRRINPLCRNMEQ